MIFNNEQVTCVGARVMGTSHDRRATMRQIFCKIDLEQGSVFKLKLLDERFEASALVWIRNFKLKSLILAQIERWRHA